MRVLVTAGGTIEPIDQVRFISNGFKGATGEAIARCVRGLKHDVTLLTSNRDFMNDDILKFQEFIMPKDVKFFRTFDDLDKLMKQEITSGGYDIVIHSAAVSDYHVARVASVKDGIFETIDNTNKISSSYGRLYLDLVPTAKIVDKIRPEWGFSGKIVKFKLQVGISDEELLEIARASMEASQADLIVANCREWYKERAYILGKDGLCVNVSRNKLAEELCRRLGL
jgi:phosphopantothenoylcysteine synthetase/decarboxylase